MTRYLMVAGMVYAQSLNLPKVATKMLLKIQIEGRVQWLERLLANNKFKPLEVMKLVATWVATSLKWSFGLRTKGNTKIEIDGQMVNASTLAIKGVCPWHESVNVTIISI